jgi:3-deoxy-manno-octulosonate cytidylyltransferase (CMP-KDO synthetase)
LSKGDHKGIVTAITKADRADFENENRVKVALMKNDYALYFSRSMIPFRRNEASTLPAWRHLGIYGFSRSRLNELCVLPSAEIERTEGLEQLRWLFNGCKIKCIKGNWKGFGIDSQEDVATFLNSL